MNPIAGRLDALRMAARPQVVGRVSAVVGLSVTVTGVPGRAVILANPAFAAYSTPDGNVYVPTGNGTFNISTGGKDYGDSVLKLRLQGSSDRR